MAKVTIFTNQIQKQLDDIYGNEPAYKDAVKDHGEGYAHFVKKELKRKGHDVTMKNEGEGTEGEYDDSDNEQADKLTLASDFVSIPSFVEWFENPA